MSKDDLSAADISAAHERVREDLAHRIHDVLEGADGILKVWEPTSKVGPLGGKKYDMLVAVEDGEEIYAAMIVVYSDENIEEHLDEEIEKAEHRAKRRRFVKDDS